MPTPSFVVNGTIGSPALPLTTIFTAGSACSTRSLLMVDSHGGLLTYKSSAVSGVCAPSFFPELQSADGIYSPGVCPLSWTAYPVTTHIGTARSTFTSYVGTLTAYVGDTPNTTQTLSSKTSYTDASAYAVLITQCVCCPSGLIWAGAGTVCQATATTLTSTNFLSKVPASASMIPTSQGSSNPTLYTLYAATTVANAPALISTTIPENPLAASFMNNIPIGAEFFVPTAYSGSAVEVASGVPVAWQSEDLPSMSPPSAVLEQLATAISNPSSSDTSPTASTIAQHTSDATSLGLDIGLGAGIPLLVFAIIGIFALRWRRKRRETGVASGPEFSKAELPGKDAEKRFGELGIDGNVGEMSGIPKPAEVDAAGREGAVELEGGWHGHEISTG